MLTLQESPERKLKTANNQAELVTLLATLDDQLKNAREQLDKPEMAALLSLYKQATDKVWHRHSRKLLAL